MNRIALVVAAVMLSAASLGALAGRTGDQLMLQEQQNQRVIAEKQKVAKMQAMLEDCLKQHSSR